MPDHIPYLTVLGQTTVDALAAHQLGRICQPKYVGGAREGEAENPARDTRPGETRDVEVTGNTPPPHPKSHGSGE